MEINKDSSATNRELMLSGRIDGAQANQLEFEVLAAIRAGAKEIFINLFRAEWICSAGLQVVLQYQRQMKNQGGRLLVTRPSPEVGAIMEMTGSRDQIVEGAQPES